jgi:hypothetical protein
MSNIVVYNDVVTIKFYIKNNTLDIKQGIFYNGQVFDAYIFISNLIKSAKKYIVLIDNYIDEPTLILFPKNLNVKTTKQFHDRFMILDKQKVYHIGASLKDLSNKIFTFNKIDFQVSDILRKV